ncbi:hypothetical protein ADK57_40055 [Streptomyces sp. MMG1533]|uniref:hypothetical protein n=1 Tax=Streptomyces sp. MMG1533 TaxID=1415546 RepID=UPI0006AEE2BE|nr:hypothetical protein [Streptomyces sp. MMG1533]KOU57118.1 hypothetical protein ADK57_40055 [Streptomyces sp. MMG1533]
MHPGSRLNAWANAAEHHDEEQFAALVRDLAIALAIALVNAFNRGNVIVRRPAGDHQPGRFA